MVATWQLFRSREAFALLLLVWALLPLALYRLATAKLRWYLLPSYPARALLVACFGRSVLPASLALRTLLAGCC